MGVEMIKAGASLEDALQSAARAMFEVLKAQPHDAPLVVGLCGGRSVVGLLKALEAESARQPAELLRRVQLFMVDERLVPLTDEQSNYGGLHRLLFAKLLEDGVLKQDQLHPFHPETGAKDSGCARYDDELGRFGGVFTVVVVGVGEDGHIAGLFPHHPILKTQDASFFPFFDSPKPPPARMTAGPALITGAHASVVLLLGEGKRQAWNTFRAGTASTEECPALLATKAPRCIVVTDLAE